MSARSPKQLTPWAPYEVPAKIAEFLADNSRKMKLVTDEDRGGYRLWVKEGTGPWAEGAHYDSQVDFALAHGVISNTEAREYQRACHG